MLDKMTVSFVDAWEVLGYVGYTDDEKFSILETGFNDVSYGDASFTLIGNRRALECILDGNRFLDNPIDEGGLVSRYWEVVGTHDFLNMENN